MRSSPARLFSTRSGLRPRRVKRSLIRGLARNRVTAIAISILVVGLACMVPQLLAKKKTDPDSGPNDQKRAVHALNRLTFGPRPGDVQQVMAMGVDRWIDQQLHPEKIDDGALQSRLEQFRTLRMSAHEMVENFPDNQIIKQVMDGKKSMPSDSARRAIYEVQRARYEAKKEEKQGKKEENLARNTTAGATSKPAPSSSSAAMPANDAGANAGSANDSAKTPEELAAAAAAGAEATQATAADANLASPSSDSSSMPASGMSMPGNAFSADATAPTVKAKIDDAQARRREDRLDASVKYQPLFDLSPDERYKKVMAMSVDEKLAFIDAVKGNKGQEFLVGMEPKQKETLLALANPQAVISDELIQAKLLRATYSQRQLEAVMTDFWLNHFNVYIGKGADRILLTSYEQDVIRPHALGKFEDLLVATAKSPAMLFYLDNWQSMGPNSPQGLGVPPHGGYYIRKPGDKRRNGLNENYGRELLELHTLSVNGGYSQHDVTEVAKVFTGWTIDKPADGGGFKYDSRMHEPGPKFVLGHKIKPRGEDEGREVLHMLATSPQTAHFISLKLAERFVSDDPPPALVERMAKTFLKKKGDIREVLSTLFHSPEFWNDTAYRAKVKTPLEFVASAVRATGADVDDAMPLARQIANMGMPLYGAQPPTGYSMKAETWVSSSALLARMNFALAFTAGKIRGVKVDPVQLAGGPPAPADAALALSTLEAKLLTADISKQTHDSIAAQIAPAPNSGMTNSSTGSMSARQDREQVQMQDQKQSQKPQRKPTDVPRSPDTNTIAGLLLGSPEFQRR